MRHTRSASAPVNNNKHFAEAFAQQYLRRVAVIHLIKQLIQLIKSVQRHRGMSMGVLGGNALFREELISLQTQIEQRLDLFGAFIANMQQLLPVRDQENLHSAWVTISHGWQDDSVIDNYELHCHLIEQLLGLLAMLGKQLEPPIAALIGDTQEPAQLGSASTLYPNRFKKLETLHFATRLMPAVTEQIGRIRALGTYTAALGHCDSDYSSRLRYAIQCARVNNEKLRHQAKRIEGLLEKDNLLLNQLKSYEIKFNFLLHLLEQDLLKEGKITLDSNRLFELSTDIIDMYLTSIDAGTALIEQWHTDEIESWINATG
jgi:hypothetical protein